MILDDKTKLVDDSKYDEVNATLLKEYQNGDLDALDKLIENNEKLVYKIAKSLACDSIDIEDLLQEGYIGLMIAANKFDLKKGNSFSTYAFNWIRQRITRYICNNKGIIRTPVYTHTVYRNINSLVNENGGNIDINKISKELGLPEESIKIILDMNKNIIPLGQKIYTNTDSGETLADIIPDTNNDTAREAISNIATKDILNIMKETLNERDYNILCDLYGFNQEGVSLAAIDIASKYNITRGRVYQIEAKCVKKLKENKKINEYYHSL